MGRIFKIKTRLFLAVCAPALAFSFAVAAKQTVYTPYYYQPRGSEGDVAVAAPPASASVPAMMNDTVVPVTERTDSVQAARPPLVVEPRTTPRKSVVENIIRPGEDPVQRRGLMIAPSNPTPTQVTQHAALPDRRYDLPPVDSSDYMSLRTRPGLDIGLQGFAYDYREPSLMKLEGYKLGIDGQATITFAKDYFATADVRYAFGEVDYSSNGTGTLDNLWDDFVEARALVGRDFVFSEFLGFPQFSVSPYTGFGYRFLYNDLRGTTSTNHSGYRRENEMIYIPIGVKPRWRLNANSRLTSTLEVDIMLDGQQTSYFSDISPGEPDVRNQQDSGVGLRADIMYEYGQWSVGPFVNYWNIDDSQVKISNSPGSICGGSPCSWIEPANNTLEAGIKFKYHFYESPFKLN
ncbi:MAG: hypothetical protein SFW62_08720 [Alphaproteobacteria bacterium]|nr:hypothetical protein [Alphaproteobacteria bacterium]